MARRWPTPCLRLPKRVTSSASFWGRLLAGPSPFSCSGASRGHSWPASSRVQALQEGFCCYA
eukprot:3827901-Pyramimonas_sp.AAC.1